MKQKEKLSNFESWEIEFMKNGPPEYEEQLESPHKFAYLDGYGIWLRLKKDPDFNPDDYAWATWAYRNKEIENGSSL